MTYIVGLDLSLTSTGVAGIDDVLPLPLDGGPPLEGVTVQRCTSKGAAGASLTERGDRLQRLVDEITHECIGADLVLVEGPSFGAPRQAGTHDRAGLWWLVVNQLQHEGRDVVEVPPATLKTYATGKGNAAKDLVLAAVVRRYPDVNVTGNDEADALVLAAMGARHLGQPIETSLPAAHLKAMDKVKWL